MHSWHLPLLLIFSILHITFSEHSSIDGRRCFHSSLAKEKIDPHGQHQLGKSRLEISGLNELNENRNGQRDESRDRIKTIRLIDDRRLDRYTLTLHERIRSTGDRVSYRSVHDGHRLNVRTQYYKNTESNYKTTFTNGQKLKVNGIYDQSLERHHRKRDLTRISENYKLNDHGHDGAYSYIGNNNDDERQIKDKHINRFRDSSSKLLKNDARQNNNERYRYRDNSNTEKQEKEIRKTKEPTNIRNSERFTEENIRDRVDRDAPEKDIRRIMHRNMVRNSVERNINERDELNNIRNSVRYSRDNYRDASSTLERGARRKTVRHEPNDVRNFKRYSRDNVHDAESSSERGTRQDNMGRTMNRNMVRDRVAQSINERNERNDIRNSERYSRDNSRDASLTLERGVRRETAKRITDREMARNREERKTNVRREPSDVRNLERYSRDNVRDAESYSERGIRQDNMEKTMNKNMVRDRVAQYINERNEPNDIRNSKRYSRDNTHDASLTLERGVRRESAKRITDREMARNREERKTNVRREPSDIRNLERYSRDNVRDAESSSERGIRQDNIGRTMNRNMVRDRVAQSINERNEPNDIRNSERYSRDNNRDASLTLERGARRETAKRITDREMARNREERKTNVRREPNDVRNPERYSRDNVRNAESTLERGIRQDNMGRTMNRNMVRDHVEQTINERNEPNDISNSERYSRYNTRDASSTLELGVRRESAKRITDREMARNREELKTDVRREPSDVRNLERYSRDNVHDAESSSERGIRQDNMGRTMNRNMVRDRVEQTINERNDPNDMRNSERYSRHNTRDASSTLERGVRREIAKIITDREMARNREERKINFRREFSDVRNFERYSRDNVRYAVSISERGIRGQSSIRILDHDIALKREKRYINERNEPNNTKKFERYSRVNTRDAAPSLERDIYEDNIRSIMDRNMIRDRADRNTNRNQANDMRNSVSLKKSEYNAASSLDLSVRRESLMRITGNDHEQRNVRIYIGKSERYSRDIRRDRASSGKFERYIKNTTHETVIPGNHISRDKDSNRDRTGRYIEFTHILRSSTINKPIVTEITKNEVSICGWQYFFYALQGVYIINIIMQERAKISSLDWLTSSSLLKVK